MLEKIIKKDKNEILENVLEQKEIDEKTKNLLQGILYKIEDSYKDYKIVKVIEKNDKQYIDEFISNIKNKTNKIKIINFNDKIEDKDLKEKIEKDKYYIKNKNIIAYPIEKKILYAIEKNSNDYTIVNNKYDFIVQPLSHLIMMGKSIDRMEVLRDFNGWAWTTMRDEIENIKVNLVYQTFQILFGKEFLDDWTADIEGIIDYYYLIQKKITDKYGKEINEKFNQLIEKIAIINEIEQNETFKNEKMKNLKTISEKTNEINNVVSYVSKLTEEKKTLEKEIAKIQITINCKENLNEACDQINEDLPIESKIFNFNILKNQLISQKDKKKNRINEINAELLPYEYFKKKQKIVKEKELTEVVYYTLDEKNDLYINFEMLFLKCFKKMLKDAKEDEIVKLIYKFRYYILLPYDAEKDIKDVENLKSEILEIEKELLKIAKKNKIVSNEVSNEVWIHIMETRIIDLKKLYFKIYAQYDKKYVQIFDENISEEKYLLNDIEKNKMNKKIKVFI